MHVTTFIFADDRPFRDCHASTLCHLGGERFLAAWFGGTREGAGDVAIWGADGGPQGWSPPRRLAKVDGRAHWNPVLFAAPDATLHLFFKVGRSPRVWETWVITSADQGATWTAPRELVPGDVGGRGPVKNKPIVLSDDAWLAPASLEVEAGERADWDVFANRTEDGGATWQTRGLVPRDPAMIAGAGAIQPSLWESAPGQVHMLCRSTCGRVVRSDSADGGRTWSPLTPTALPNNNSGLDLAHLPDGTLVLACNPVGGDWGPRTPLSLATSDDNGATWTRRLDLETEPGEYSYPSIIPLPDGRVAVSYTWRRERVGFWMGEAG